MDSEREFGKDQAFEAQHEPFAGKIRRWRWDDFEYAGIRFLNVTVTLTQADSGTTELEFSATTTDHGWRGDVFTTIFLKDAGGSNFAQYPLPVVQAFCGTTDHFKKVGINS